MPRNNGFDGELIVSPALLGEVGGDFIRGQQYARKELAEAAASDNVVHGLKGVHDAHRTGLEAITAALRTPDPHRTQEGHYMDVQERALKWLDETAKAFDTANVTANDTLKHIDAEIAEKLAIADGPRGAEIRSYFRALKDGERVNRAMDCVAKGDKETLGALFSTEGYLSGFKDDQFAAIKRHYSQLHAADLVERRANIALAMDINRRTADEAIEAYDAIFPRQRTDAITQRVTAARSAKDAVFKL